MLQNEYLVAKIGVDTAENEPFKICKFGKICKFCKLADLRDGARLLLQTGAAREGAPTLVAPLRNLAVHRAVLEEAARGFLRRPLDVRAAVLGNHL